MSRDLNNKSSRIIGATRYIMLIAVIAIFIGSTVMLLVGTFDMLSGIWSELTKNSTELAKDMRLILIESVDTILISTVLYVIAVGLYQLFVNPRVDLPKWLHTSDVDDLDKRLVGMVATILAVSFLTTAISGKNSENLMYLGIAYAVIILAISAFLYQDKKKK